MIISELRTYLKTHLSKPALDFKWSDEDNRDFFDYFKEKYSTEFLQDPENQLMIKQVFKEYFEAVGYILFKINENQIRVKVFAYKIEPKDSINLPAVIDILYHNEDLIEYDYRGKENQISIPSELRAKIFDFVNSIENEEINKKELVRFAVNEFFELQASDIVIIKSDQIFIKELDERFKRPVAENEKDTIANRFSGYNEEDLESFYHDIFAKSEYKDFFHNVAKTYVDIYMLENKIDNFTYEKNVFSDIQSIVAEELSSVFDKNDDFLNGFSGYVFRLHFKEVFGHIANLMLGQIAISNDYIATFIKYYASNIIVLDGKKYRVPELESENGMRWNVVSMLSIVKIYIKTKSSVDILRKSIADLNKKINVLYIGNLSPVDYQSLLNRERDKITEKIASDEQKLERLQDSFEISKSDDKKAILKNEMAFIKDTIQTKKEEKAKITSRTIKASVIAEYNALRKELDPFVRQATREERVLAQNEETYLSIKYALVKALTSKKQLLD